MSYCDLHGNMSTVCYNCDVRPYKRALAQAEQERDDLKFTVENLSQDHHELQALELQHRAVIERLKRGRDEARKMIVLLMEQREWGAATGALLEDPVVKAAYKARESGGEGE